MKSSLKSSVIILAILISIVSLGIGISTAAGKDPNNPSVVKIGPTTRGDSLSFEQLQKIKIMVIDSPPRPPKGIKRFSVTSMPQSALMLSVPTSTWTYGCSATSAGMIFGYYDRNGYSNMYTGPTNGGVAPMTDLGQGIGTPIPGSCSIIATQNGFDGRTTRGHVDDYWTGYLNPGPDPWEGYWTEHTWGECTADYMGTNQWKWDYDLDGTRENDVDGATIMFSWDDGQKLDDSVPSSSYGLPQTELCHGMRLFAESRGYTVQENYTQKIDPVTSGGFSLADYRTEINNGHPVMIQLVGHTMVGVGYESASSQTIYVNDTWDNSVHSMTWGGSYSGMQHWGVTVIHLNPANPVPPVAQDRSASTQINTPVTITLVAIDDGLPNPPGALTYIITSLPSNGELSDPGAGSITAVPYTLAGNGNQVIYTPDVSFTGSDSFQFRANDGGTPPDGGDSNQANVSIAVGPIYVDVNATGANNGSSWADAYTGLQSALSAAVAGDEIWVAAGTYKPTTDTDRTISFVMRQGVVIYGGFAGTETSHNQRNWVAHPTILSGDIGIADNNSDNSYHVVIGENNATLDGFTIAGGNANGEDWPYYVGGGMFNWTSPTITNCTFSKNSADYGGGMYNYYGGSPTFTNCTFSGNSANTDGSGGGMFNWASNPTITNCTFSGNSANTGGGMYNGDSSPTITNCKFIANSAPSGEYPGCGGGMEDVNNSPIVTNCTFNGNSANYGGGMFNYSNSIPILTNCTFSGNLADYGGGMDNGNVSNPTINNCILWGNTAPYGPQIYNFDNSNSNITYSNVQGGQPGTGNINRTPLFIGAGDFRLQGSSPCIDAGNNSAMPTGVTTDLAGNPRFIDDPHTFDTGAGTPPIVDMGAFEYIRPQYSITASAGPNGTISPSGIFNVYQGDNQSFTATPNTGYMVDKWYLGGNPAQTGGLSYALNNIQADAIVLVNFKPTVVLTMAVSPSEAGITVPAIGTNEVAKNEAKSIETHANAGYVFNRWTASPAENVIFGNSNSPSTTVTLSGDATVTANFLPPVNLTMAAQPPEGGTTTPSVGTLSVGHGVATPIEANATTGYVFSGWTASPAENVIFGNPNNPSTTVTLSGNATVTANFLPPVSLTMAAQPPEGGTTTPSVGTSSVEHGLAIPIEAHANTGYAFNGWTASPAENVIFGNSNSPSTMVTLSGNATVTANFNAKPVAAINATATMLVITNADSVTLDATGSTDDGLPNPPGVLTYFWEKVTGPNKCSISNPNAAVTEVSFSGTGIFEFRLTVYDGQLENTQLITITVVLDVAYVSTAGDDDTGLGTAASPFASIQNGINTVQDNGTVLVLPGTYYENINFGSKKVTVRSNNPNDANVVANSIINANGSGSAVVFDSGEDANSVLTGFTITGGDTEVGGGIYINEASPVVERNVIRGNRAGSEGGGIYCQGGSATIRYNEISNNYSGFAGGVSFETSFAVLQNNLIVNNNADYDSGVACVEGQPRIANNTIAGNVAVYDYDSSGLLIVSSLPPIISNNIMAFNYGAPGVVDFGGFDPNYFNYNDVYGHPNGNYLSWVLPAMDQTGVNGNISVNPLFADTDANNYHLLPASLLIDAGDPSSDWNSEPRPNGGRINMGAYGNTPEASCSVAGDITWDKKVDFRDFAKLAFYWLKNEPSVDIAPLVSGDNIVDVGDLAVLAEHWLEGI